MALLLPSTLTSLHSLFAFSTSLSHCYSQWFSSFVLDPWTIVLVAAIVLCFFSPASWFAFRLFNLGPWAFVGGIVSDSWFLNFDSWILILNSWVIWFFILKLNLWALVLAFWFLTHYSCFFIFILLLGFGFGFGSRALVRCIVIDSQFLVLDSWFSGFFGFRLLVLASWFLVLRFLVENLELWPLESGFLILAHTLCFDFWSLCFEPLLVVLVLDLETKSLSLGYLCFGFWLIDLGSWSWFLVLGPWFWFWILKRSLWVLVIVCGFWLIAFHSWSLVLVYILNPGPFSLPSLLSSWLIVLGPSLLVIWVEMTLGPSNLILGFQLLFIYLRSLAPDFWLWNTWTFVPRLGPSFSLLGLRSGSPTPNHCFMLYYS